MQAHQKDPRYPLFQWLVHGEWHLPPCIQLKRYRLAHQVLNACIREAKRSAY